MGAIHDDPIRSSLVGQRLQPVLPRFAADGLTAGLTGRSTEHRSWVSMGRSAESVVLGVFA